LHVANAEWARWTPINLAAIVAHLLGGAGLLLANKARVPIIVFGSDMSVIAMVSFSAQQIALRWGCSVCPQSGSDAGDRLRVDLRLASSKIDQSSVMSEIPAGLPPNPLREDFLLICSALVEVDQGLWLFVRGRCLHTAASLRASATP
jgi:hypothetical protein